MLDVIREVNNLFDKATQMAKQQLTEEQLIERESNKYCQCTSNEPEEIKRGVIICLKCNHEVNPADLLQFT